MPIDPKQKGRRGENELARMLTRVDGVSVRKQPASGAIGTRAHSGGLRGDLKLLVGDTIYRCEVKRRKSSPQVLENWLSGVEVLAIRADQGDWRFYMPQSTFLDLVGLAAEGIRRRRP